MGEDGVVGVGAESGGITIFAVAEEWPRKRKAKADSSPGLRPVRNDKTKIAADKARPAYDKTRIGADKAKLAPNKVKLASDNAGLVPDKAGLTPKELGEIAEAGFLAKASAMGLWVAKPWGDSRRYDFIVDCGGRLQRVQVKAAFREGKDGGYSLRTHGHSQRAYREDEIDALVGYVAPVAAWYVIPVKVVRRLRSLKLFPGSRKKRSKFEKWREAWEVLREGR